MKLFCVKKNLLFFAPKSPRAQLFAKTAETSKSQTCCEPSGFFSFCVNVAKSNFLQKVKFVDCAKEISTFSGCAKTRPVASFETLTAGGSAEPRPVHSLGATYSPIPHDKGVWGLKSTTPPNKNRLIPIIGLIKLYIFLVRERYLWGGWHDNL